MENYTPIGSLPYRTNMASVCVTTQYAQYVTKFTPIATVIL